MKKFTLFVAALFIAGAANAQDMTSKRGVNILPEAGDISISMSAAPFIDYLGGFMGGFSGSDDFVSFVHPFNFISGRYFLDETKAVRAGLRIGFGSTNDKTLVDGNVDATKKFELNDKESYNSIVLTGGLEFRRGNYGRFQGYYGGELLFGIMGTKTEVDRLAVDANGNDVVYTTTDKAGSSLTLGLQGFIGVEYFLAPKVALGGEFTWGFMLQSTGEGEVTDTAPGSTAVKTAGSSAFSLDTGTGFTTTGGNLKLSFFF
jgi:hypothetical protein